MKTNRRSLFIQSALLLMLLVTPLSATEAYEDKKISKVEVVVDSADPSLTIDPTPIKKLLKTQEGGTFSQINFDQDLKALSEQYDSPTCDISSQEGNLIITIHVVPKATIREINFTGNEKFSSKKLQGELDVKQGILFNKQEFTKSFNKIKAFYFKRGYFESQIDYQLIPVPNSNSVDVQIRIEEGRPGKIKKIILNGFTKSEKNDITEQMYLRKYNFLYSWATGSGMYSDEAMEQDRMVILTYLHNKGYADARIDINMSEDPSSEKLILQINADRGAQYHIGTVELEGNTLISTEDLRAKFDVKEGSLYSPQKIQETSQLIKDAYGQKGHIDASVNYETILNEQEPLFNLTFTIEEGQQYKIGLVHIFGNTSTKNNVILRESLLVPGETFDSRKLKATQQRLEAVGYFKSVNVYAVRTEADEEQGESYRDVYIEVEETSTGNVSLFAGYSSSDSISGGLELTERNFNIANLGRALKGDIGSLRGGGQYFHIRGTIGSRQKNVLISWLNPYVYDSLWRLGVELSATFSELQSKETKVTTYGGSVYTAYPISNYLTAGMRQRVREIKDKLSLEPLGQSQAALDSLAVTKNLFQRDGVVSAFSLNLGYDTVDSTYKPHRGLRSYLEPEIAGVGGRFQFGKLSYLNTLYIPVWKTGTLKFRGDLKFLMPYDNTNKANAPYSEKFFMGGDSTMRGYKAWGFGPRIKLMNDSNQLVSTDTPQGGLSSFYLSAELNQEIFKMLDVFAFCDMGSLSPQVVTLNKFRATAGVGLRIDLGNRAPIMLGYGYVFNKFDRDTKKQPFFFSMSGQF